ncbi:MAG: sugar phosphate nucleotidyltransferase [Deltaproteobacteria bacterium]|nr:sugar phosphate nucleotidyltransferase [Deltaproteobacteria bacterium]
MKAIILAGGLGTRLRPLTFAIPKPLIPVGERPILEILIENLKTYGVTDIYLAVGYRAELIQVYFQDGRQFGVNIQYSQEDKRLGTAGPLRLIRDRFGISEPVLVMNSDIITKLNFEDFYESHLREAAVLTVGIREHEYIVPYGVVEMEERQICSIEERPKLSFNISCGIYVLSPSILDLVPDNQFFDMPDLIRLAIRNGHRTFVYQIREKWAAIESLEDLTEETNRRS